MKFINKTRYRKDVIRTYYTREQNISKTKLVASKIVISRPTLLKLLKQYAKYSNLLNYKPNNQLESWVKHKLLDEVSKTIKNLNINRKKHFYIPIFKMLYDFSNYNNNASLRTFQERIKNDNFFLPSCTRKTWFYARLGRNRKKEFTK